MPVATSNVDEKLYQFCTVSQLEKLEAINQHGSMRAAARALKCDYVCVYQALQAVRAKAARSGYSPEHDWRQPVPEGFIAKGVSTMYDKEGKVRAQWVLGRADPKQQERIVRDAVQALMQDVPRVPATVAPAGAGWSAALCNVVTLTDVHVGAYAWGKETGAPWDLEIAERTVGAAVRHLVRAMPPAHTCVVAQLGDFMHQDGLAAVTPTSGHNLDSDSRFSKVVQVAVRVLRDAVALALASHQRVVLLVAEGNHDISGSVWMRHLFSLLYEHEPRVTVIDSEMPYYVHQHGRVMLAWHHGHLKKIDHLPLLFAAQFPEVWGSTKWRYAHSGHLHHKHEKEHSGITMIQHPTIAARDAYAARGGWIADREMTGITYHQDYGQVARATVNPEMLA